ncbi:MAG: hypothetical protein ABIN94_20085 [Ferruginibacter sp.]
MKLKLFSIPCLLILSIALLTASCTKEGTAGATGPAGPAGPAGANGANGPAGVPGATGPAGTANVIYSDWLNVTFTGTDSTGWFGQIPAPKLVDSILNKGEIKVYLNIGSDSLNSQVVLPLPISNILVDNDVINPFFQLQLIRIVSYLDESSFKVRNYNYWQYRYILIPGGTKSGRGVRPVDWNNYKEVKAYLGLKD